LTIRDSRIQVMMDTERLIAIAVASWADCPMSRLRFLVNLPLTVHLSGAFPGEKRPPNEPPETEQYFDDSKSQQVRFCDISCHIRLGPDHYRAKAK